MIRKVKGFRLVKRLKILVLFLVGGTFLLPELEAEANTKDPAPRPELKADEDETIVARRRRRRRRRRPRARRRRRKKPIKRPAPKADPRPAPTPASDLSNNTTSGSSGNVDPGALRRGGRVEFDGRLIQGQTAKSGAIYLFARKRTQLRSMVNERTEFRREILRTVYPTWKK